MPGKRIQIDPETWSSLDLLGKDRRMTFQELFQEGMSDLLKKYRRPRNLKEQLRQSAVHAVGRANHGRRKRQKPAA
jgi:hypothetical protein